jgi:2-polyprenyl-3-methyl-5-hydroxy-6-metoxy-1,4-benzoquinol methylase
LGAIGTMSNRELRRDQVIAQYASDEAAADYAQSYSDSRPSARFFRARLQIVLDALAEAPGGDLLDAGCGPGMLVRNLLATSRNDFGVTALDQSFAMIRYCAASTGAGNMRLAGIPAERRHGANPTLARVAERLQTAR